MKDSVKRKILKLTPRVLRVALFEVRRKKKRRVLISRYRGNQVKCVVCSSTFREFVPFGQPLRKNAQCPNCESLERHRLLWKYLGEETNIFTKKVRLLHFAPEEVYFRSFSSARNIDYYPVDLMPEYYNYAGSDKIVTADITDIPFDEDYFDVILCNQVLEHIPDDARAMRELFRVMKPGGWGVFQVPIDHNLEVTYEDSSITDPKEREKVFGQRDHVRWYGRDYPERLRKVGFKIEEDDYVTSFSDEEQLRLGFMKTETIYKATKGL